MDPLGLKRHKAQHRLHVIDALMRGEPVPDSVLADYPDLRPAPPTEHLFAHLEDEPEETPATPEHDLDAPLADLLDISKQTRKALISAVSEWIAGLEE